MAQYRPSNFKKGALAAGERIYAIGDVHGEATILARLLRLISEDIDKRGPASTTLVFLGDVIDRGSNAAGLLIALSGLANDRLKILKGNHESVLVDCYRGDDEAFIFWLKFGGRSTLLGLGISEGDLDTLSQDELLEKFRACLNATIVEWLDKLPLYWSAGGYFFVHAGIHPGIALQRQDEDDFLWIRDKFLSSPADHGKIIIHGHTIEPGVPTLGGNRIGLDTGAHEHGVLSALGLEGASQWIIQADDAVDCYPSLARETGEFDHILEIESLINQITGHDTSTETKRSKPLSLADSPVDTPTVNNRWSAARSKADAAALLSIGLASLGGYYYSSQAPLQPRPVARKFAVKSNDELARASIKPVENVQIPDAKPPSASHAVPAEVGLQTRPRRRPLTKKSIRQSDVEEKADLAQTVTSDQSDVKTAEPNQTVAVRLYGAELERALVADRIATRQLNDTELAKRLSDN